MTFFLHPPPFRFDGLLQSPAFVGEPEPDKTAIAIFTAAREQPGGRHARRSLHHSRRRHAEQGGDLAGCGAIALPQGRKKVVLPEMQAVTLHRLLGERAQRLRGFAVQVQKLGQMPAMGRWRHLREETVRASSISATFLRPGGFMTNALDWAPTIREGGYILDPLGPGRYAPIDPADIAAVAALALTEDGHQGKDYVLTGEELFTIAEQVRVLAGALAREIEVRATATPEEAVRARFPNGAPPALAEALIEGFARMRADAIGFRTETFARLLGRKPRTFADWCAENANAFQAPHETKAAS